MYNKEKQTTNPSTQPAVQQRIIKRVEELIEQVYSGEANRKGRETELARLEPFRDRKLTNNEMQSLTIYRTRLQTRLKEKEKKAQATQKKQTPSFASEVINKTLAPVATQSSCSSTSVEKTQQTQREKPSTHPNTSKTSASSLPFTAQPSQFPSRLPKGKEEAISSSSSSMSQSEPTTPKPVLLQTGDINIAFAGEESKVKGGQFHDNKMVGIDQHVEHHYHAPTAPKTLSDLNPWGIFPKESPHFVERPLIIDEITKQLEQSEKSIVLSALHGLGGIGKTQLATYYARSQAAQERYPFRAWFNAENETTLQLSYISLGQRAGIIDEKSTLEEKVEQVKQWLSHPKNRGWLLVFDNAVNYNSLTPYIPSEGGKVLITSRNETWNIPRIPIPLFTEKEARELILKQSGCPAEEPALTDLIEELGYLPLALAQAAAYIKMELSDDMTPMATYLELYRQSKAAWLKANPLSDDSMLGKEAPPSVSVTFEMSFKALTKMSPISLEFLFHCSLLASDPIPMDILRESVGNKPEGQGPERKIPFNEGLKGLKQYSLLQTDTKEQTVNLHRLLKVLLMERFDSHSLKERWGMWEKMTNSMSDNFTERNLSVEERERRIGLLSHLQSLLEVFNNLITVTNEAEQSAATSLLPWGESPLSGIERMRPTFELTGAALLSRIADVHHLLKNAKEIIPFLKRILAIEEKHLGAEHPSLATTLSNLGVAYGDVGQYQQAIALHERALAIEEKHLGAEHPDLAITLSNLGVAYSDVGQYQQAIALHKRALDIQEKHLGAERPALAITLSNLGLAYRNVGQYQQAIALHERALAIGEKHLGAEHPTLATTLSNLGAAYRNVGQYQQAIALHERALAIEEKHFGAEHPTLAATLSNLGIAYGEVGQYQQAIALHEHALDIQEKHFGAEHPTLAATLSNLGIAYGEVGQYQRTIALHERALDIKEKHLGAEHPSLGATLSNLGVAYGKVGQYQQAITLHERALAIEEKHFGAEHPDLATILSNLGIAYREVGQYQKAIALHERALDIQEKHLGAEHPTLATTLSNLGTAYGEVGQYQQAITLTELALGIQEKHFGTDHPNTATIRINLALARQDLMQAESLNGHQRRIDKAKTDEKEELYENDGAVTDDEWEIYDPAAFEEKQEKSDEATSGCLQSHSHQRQDNNSASSYSQATLISQLRTLSIDSDTITNLKASFPTPYTGTDDTLLELANLMQQADGTKQKDIQLQIRLADKFVTLNHPAYAIRYYEQAVMLMHAQDNQTIANIHSPLARCYQTQGEADKARHCFEAGIAMWPAPAIHIHYAHCLYTQKDYQSALGQIKAGLALMSSKPETLNYQKMDEQTMELGLRVFWRQRQPTQGKPIDHLSIPATVLASYLTLRCHQQSGSKEEQTWALADLIEHIDQAKDNSLTELLTIVELPTEELNARLEEPAHNATSSSGVMSNV